jgi:hypothetical protein
VTRLEDKQALEDARLVVESYEKKLPYVNGRACTTTELLLARALLRLAPSSCDRDAAIEAIEAARFECHDRFEELPEWFKEIWRRRLDYMVALKGAPRQPAAAPEPVAWRIRARGAKEWMYSADEHLSDSAWEAEPLYTAPLWSEAPQEWIPVSERLPKVEHITDGDEYSDVVLVHWPNGYIGNGQYGKKDGWMWCEQNASGIAYTDPTHWMPLPTAPRPEPMPEGRSRV